MAYSPAPISQEPADFPIREAFQAVRDLIITKPQLYNRLITVWVRTREGGGGPHRLNANTSMIYNWSRALFHYCIFTGFSDAGDYRIVGCPKTIEDNKYARNALIFNVVFVFTAQADTSPYEAVVQKLGEAFKTYEVSRILATDMI